MLSKLFVLFCFLSVTIARSATSSKLNIVVDDKLPDSVFSSHLLTGSTARSNLHGLSSYMNDIKYLYRAYQDCMKSDVTLCLKMKLITTMDRTFRNLKDVEVIEGIKFVKDESEFERNTPVKTEEDIEKSLPRSLEEKDSVLNSYIFKEIISFLKSHTLQIKFPSNEERSVNENNTVEGRGKDKNKGSYVMIPLLLGGTFIPIAYGALALLAGKALIVSKLALVLASIIGIKKLVSGSGGHHESSHEVVVGHGHSGWGRNADGQNLAYNGYSESN